MTALSSIDPARFLHEQLASASPDLLRRVLTTFINTLMSAEADSVCGAPTANPHPHARTCATATGTASSIPSRAP
jgi:transposase-like protein